MTATGSRPARESRRGWLLAAGLCLLHSAAVVISTGGFGELASPWPIPRDDHPFHFHTSETTRGFLLRGGTTAGYDPSFMAGYALSAVTTPSTNLAELFQVAFAPMLGPARAYKWFAVAATAGVAWLVLWSARIWGGNGRVAAATVAFYLTYLWTDFPINYARFGMLGHLLVVPLALATTGYVANYLARGGAWDWLRSAIGIALVLMVHPLGLMVLAPAVLAAYLWALAPGRFSWGRALAVWPWGLLAILLNAWWWWPAWKLWSTGESSPYAFVHDEPIWLRFGQMLSKEAPIQVCVIAGLPGGWLILRQRQPVRAAALLGFVGAGFFWGYLAGVFRALDGLQPGRQTYAFYTGATLACGFLVDDLEGRLRALGRGMHASVVFGALLIAARLFGPAFSYVATTKIFAEKRLLASRPSADLRWLVDRIRRHVPPGSRILYEEGGSAREGTADPFDGDRYGGLLPHLTGVEVIGGPFLHVPMKTNFVQFGDEKLCGFERWGRAQFLEVSAIYRPSAIVCWSPRSRAFCRENTDLVEILDENDRFLIARILGEGGKTIAGRAKVTAEAGRLVVEDAEPGLDGRVVLSYHFDPHLKSDPPIPLEPVSQGSDPVPFIGFRPIPGRITLGLDLSP